MTDVQEQAENVTAAKLARLERLCGRFPVLSSENRRDYEELLISLLEHHTPRNFLGERLIKYLAFSGRCFPAMEVDGWRFITR
jgi:hypothetical protein